MRLHDRAYAPDIKKYLKEEKNAGEMYARGGHGLIMASHSSG
jgi:hypothetical protein